MRRIYPICTISGDSFSPLLLEKYSGLRLSKAHEPGEIGKFGRFKGEECPFGSGFLKPDEELLAENRQLPERWMIDTLAQQIDTIRECGGDKIVLHFEIQYCKQCNLEFSPNLLRRIADMNIIFTISCYEDCSEDT